MSALLHLLAAVGAVTIAAAVLGFVYYIATRRPTPDATIREAVASIRWRYGIGVLVVPPALVGLQDGPGVALLGASMGGGLLLFVTVLQWWWGPI